MVNYQEVRVKPTNTQLNKSNSAAKNKTGTIVRLNKKNFEDDELPHQSFLTGISGRGFRRAGRGYMGKNFKFALPLSNIEIINNLN